MVFYWTDLLLFPAIAQGFLIALILQGIKGENRAANSILAYILVCAATMLIGRIVYWRYPPDWLFQWTLFPDTIIFLFGPLTFFFVKKLLFVNDKPSMAIHFLPAAIHLVSCMYFLTIGVGHFDTLVATRKIGVYFFFVECAGLIFNLFYLYKGNEVRSRYIVRKRHLLSYHPQGLLFLNLFLTAVLVGLTFWTVSFISSHFFSKQFRFIDYNTVWFSISLLTYLVGYYMLVQPDIFRIPIVNHLNHGKDRINVDEVEKLKYALKRLMVQRKLFANSDLTLEQLAKELGTSPNNLSWLLNQVHQKKFYDFINEYRVAAFIEKVKLGEHSQKTILALAMEVGFNSKSTFNRAFKAEMNDTPSQYIKQLQNASKSQFKYSA